MTDKVFTNRRKGDRVQNALLSMSAAMLLWIIQQLFVLSSGIAGIQPRLAAIEIQAAAAYRASDARRDFAELDKRIQVLERKPWHGDSR